MEPNTRKPRKGSRATERPFYESEGPTSANIVAEARSLVRTLETKRPFTPVDSKRTLFGNSCPKHAESRPPSAFSLGHFQYEGETSRPPSGRRLTPIEKMHDLPADGLVPSPPSRTGGSGRRPVRKSMPGLSDPQTFDVRDSLFTPIAKPSDGIGHGEICKRHSPLNSPPTSANGLRRSSVGPLPAPPGIKADSVTPRRVRSGPKERIGPAVEDVVRVRSGPPQRSWAQDGVVQQSEETSEKAELHKKAERAGSGEKRTKKTSASEKATKDELAGYFDEQVKPLLSQMEKKFVDKNVADLCRDCLRLWHVLEKKNMLGKASGSSSSRRRGEILRTIFKFLDSNDPRIRLRISRLILSMKVTGNNLTNVCMVVYRVAKAEKNDEIFMEEDMLRCIVDTIKSSNVESHCDALLYSAGALKHLSNSNLAVQKEIVSCGGIQALASVMNSICCEMLSDKQGLQVSGLLVQVTGALRNLADVNGAREIFISSGVLKNLALVLGPYSRDSELVWNVSRALSKLTLYTECCNVLSNTESCFKALMKILKEYETKQEVVVRVCFILGNLTSKSDEARYSLCAEDSSTEILLSVMQTYFNYEMECMKSGNEREEQVIDENKGLSKNEDVLIKAIRVIANLCINVDAGPSLASNNHLIDLLIQILDVKEISSSEELVLNTVATLNNLSYYGDTNSAISQKQLEITEQLISLLLPENMDAMVEASRVFGNFSRSREVRAALVEHKVDEIMIALLDAGDRETVFAACGVLINLMTDEHTRPKLKEEEGVKKLIDVLRDFGKNDWHLAAMVCQILWNYSDSITNSIATFGEQETAELSELLEEYLDEETALDREGVGSLDPNLACALREMWESQFVPVGGHLLRRVRANHTDLVPLEAPS